MLISISSFNSCVDKTVIKSVMDGLKSTGYTTMLLSDLDTKSIEEVASKKIPEIVSSVGLFNSKGLNNNDDYYANPRFKNIVLSCISHIVQGIIKLDYIFAKYANSIDSDCIYFTDYDVPSVVTRLLNDTSVINNHEDKKFGNLVFKAVRDIYKYFYVDLDFKAFGGLELLSDKKFKTIDRYYLDYPCTTLKTQDYDNVDTELLKGNYREFVNSFGFTPSNVYYLTRLALDIGNNVLYKSRVFSGFQRMRPSTESLTYDLVNREFTSRLVGKIIRKARKERIARSKVKIALC